MNKRKYGENGLWSLPFRAESLLESGIYSDLIIKCKEKEFKVHRAVVCLQSEPVAGFLRPGSLESTTGLIDLSEDDIELVEIVIRYLYTGELILPAIEPTEPPVTATSPDNLPAEGTQTSLSQSSSLATPASTPQPNSLTLHMPSASITSDRLLLLTRTYILADRLDISGLRALLANHYRSFLLREPVNTTNFLASLKLMWDGTMLDDWRLKRVAVDWAGGNAKNMMAREDFKFLCKGYPDLGFEIFKASIAKGETGANTGFLGATNGAGQGIQRNGGRGGSQKTGRGGRGGCI